MKDLTMKQITVYKKTVSTSFHKYQSEDYRHDELIRIIEHSLEKLTLAELEALYLGFSDDPTHVPYCLIK